MSKKVVVNIKYLMEKHNIKSLRKLAEMCDIRHAALSELENGKRENINFGHIVKIADTLGIDDINEILSLVDTKTISEND